MTDLVKPFSEVPPESKDARIARLERELEAAITRLSDSDAEIGRLRHEIDNMAGALRLTADEIRLMCGELTAGEMRAVKAMLGSRLQAILDRKVQR